MHIKIASIMLVASVLGLTAIMPVAYAQDASQDVISAIAGGFESITVAQDANTIVITITKEGGEPAEPGTGENVTTPTDPIIIVPPNNETGQNGTVIVPEPLPPVENVTGDGNVTLPIEPPVIIVDPDGNATQVEPPSNVTVIDNGTVVVAPPDQPVTETPGNVTIIDPPPGNATAPEEPTGCQCPEPGGPTLPIDDTGSQPVQPPVDNTTVIVEQPPAPPAEEGGNGDGGGDGNGNGDGNGG